MGAFRGRGQLSVRVTVNPDGAGHIVVLTFHDPENGEGISASLTPATAIDVAESLAGSAADAVMLDAAARRTKREDVMKEA